MLIATEVGYDITLPVQFFNEYYEERAYTWLPRDELLSAIRRIFPSFLFNGIMLV